MPYYAFKNIRNGKLISGTNFGKYPHEQILEDNKYRTPLIVPEKSLAIEAERRNISPKTYRAIQVEVKEVQKMNRPENKCPFCGDIVERFAEICNGFCSCGAKYYPNEKMWYSRRTGEKRKGVD